MLGALCEQVANNKTHIASLCSKYANKGAHGREVANNAEIDEGMLERLTRRRERDRLRGKLMKKDMY